MTQMTRYQDFSGSENLQALYDDYDDDDDYDENHDSEEALTGLLRVRKSSSSV